MGRHILCDFDSRNIIDPVRNTGRARGLRNANENVTIWIKRELFRIGIGWTNTYDNWNANDFVSQFGNLF